MAWNFDRWAKIRLAWRTGADRQGRSDRWHMIDIDAATVGLMACAKACFAKNSGAFDIASAPLASRSVSKTSIGDHEAVRRT
jgi:hypothetical protein